MSYQKSQKLIIAVILVLSFLVGCGGSTPTVVSETPAVTPTPEPTATPEPPVKILFIGNSLTYWNKGLDHNLEQLAGSANPPLVIETDAVVLSGATLEDIWKITQVREVIDNGAYDVVVLQEDLPLTDVDTFHEYARKFDAEIKEAGAEPVLFMAWPVRESDDTCEFCKVFFIEEIARAHRDIAAELGADVAPVGLAWQRAMEERPELDLYYLDGDHPSIHGTYLAINVVYATVFGKSPIGLAYQPTRGRVGVTEEEAAFLQRIAWETVHEYHAQ